MVRGDQPAFLTSRAFWSFVSDQRSDAVRRRLQDQVGAVPAPCSTASEEPAGPRAS